MDPDVTNRVTSTTMDKHQRKQMARWEQTKAKSERKFFERMKEEDSRREWRKVAVAVESYTPHPARVFAKAVELLNDYPLLRENWHHNLMYWPLYFDAPYFIIAGNRWAAPPPPDFEKEVRKGRERKETQMTRELLPTLIRHMDRVDTIREELVLRAQRNRVIQDCRMGYKEELMMNVWHPRRVERILTLYGWEALDNLLGVE